MRELYDTLAIGVALVLAAAFLFFVPSIIALGRRVRAFRSISAQNALMMLTLLIGWSWIWLLWVTAGLWVWTTVWATTFA